MFYAYGEGDKNIHVEESVSRLQELGKDITIKIYPAGGHGPFEPSTYEVSADCLSDLEEFIKSIGD